MLGPKLLLYKMKGLAFQVSCAYSACCRPAPRPCQAARGISLSAHIQLNVLDILHVVMLRTQTVRMKSLQAAMRPADLAPVRFNC